MPARRHAPTGDPALKSPARRRLRAQVKRDAIRQGRGCEMPTCVMPTRQIAWAAPPLNPWAYVLDEIVSRDDGGSAIDPNNVRPAHHRCNSVAGALITQRKLKAKRARSDAGQRDRSNIPMLIIDDF